MFINVGARSKEGGLFATKKAMREALNSQPGEVVFYKTSPLDNSGLPSTITVETLPLGAVLTVVGPNPYTKRSWYASVQKRPDGSLKVS
jgi:hypothetical protein